MIFLLALGIVLEHPAERLKEWIASLLAKRSKPVYIAHWMTPFFVFCAALALISLTTNARGQQSIQDSFLTTAVATIWYEISHLWKKKKRENVPLHTPPDLTIQP